MGQVTSTVLSLLVIPVVFTCVDDLLQWLRRHVLPERLESSGGGEAERVRPTDFWSPLLRIEATSMPPRASNTQAITEEATSWRSHVANNWRK